MSTLSHRGAARADPRTQSEHYIAYAPRGCGLQYAVVYFVEGEDVYGWWVGFRDYQYALAFFKLERFYALADTLFYATQASDVYEGWCYNYASSSPRLDEPVRIEDARCHQLEALQDAFAAEWLWIRGDPLAEEEARQYASAELAVQDVNVRLRMLKRFTKDDPVWIHRSHSVDHLIIDYLRAHWPLNYYDED